MTEMNHEIRGQTLWIEFNRPQARNALTFGMYEGLAELCQTVPTDGSVRAVVLSGAGKAFCAGHDLKQMTAGRQAEDGGKAYFNALFAQCAHMMLSIRALPQPVIAAPHGIATAAGCQLVATCDMAIAQSGTRFGVNGVNIGLFCSTPMVALSRNIGRKQAFEMLTTGSFIEADRAAELGLINRVSEDAVVDALALAETVASKLAAAVKIGKEGFYKQAEMSLEEAYAYTGAAMAENMLFRDTEEGISAFLEKRTPTWEQ